MSSATLKAHIVKMSNVVYRELDVFSDAHGPVIGKLGINMNLATWSNLVNVISMRI